MVTFDQVKLAAATGYALSLIFTVIPPLQRWFDGLGEWRPLFMFVALGLMAFLWVGINCSFILTCVQANAIATIVVWITAFASNQGGHMMLTQPVKHSLAK